MNHFKTSDMNDAFFDLHTHTTYSDGKNSPEEMIRSAMAKKMTAIGISDHSDTFFDRSYCMLSDNYASYQKELAFLKEKYCDDIDIFCGIEQDFFSEETTEGFDYIIGSVHYIRVNKHYIPVDESPEILTTAADDYFHGDMLALTECYFETAGQIVNRTGADIIGHFDLISKFNEDHRLFDPQSPRYIAAWQRAADDLLKTHRPFEINTGAMSRGYRRSPYPSQEMIDYISEHGGCFIFSGDAHNTKTIGYEFLNLKNHMKDIELTPLSVIIRQK